MHRYRSHTCGELRASDVGTDVRLSGWLHNRRDLGGILFIDLRDHYGITQLVARPGTPAYEALDKVTKESTVRVDGQVVSRGADNVNADLPTGEIEVEVGEVELLGAAAPLPFTINTEDGVNEERRLEYRFLDLRRERMHRNIMLRTSVISAMRHKMTALGFNEMATPILSATSPEGARDFVVPSRLHAGRFYALPQAPQQFKQLLMISGFDRYFQIAPCFRDEDARADRSPGEFYQLDVEMSFVEQEDVFQPIEKLMTELFEEFGGGRHVTSPFPRIPFRESMLKYGSDKPDLRAQLELVDITDIFEGSEFKAFAGKHVRALAVPDVSSQPRKFFDQLGDFAVSQGAKGLAWVRVAEDGSLSGPIAKFLTEENVAELTKRLSLAAWSRRVLRRGRVRRGLEDHGRGARRGRQARRALRGGRLPLLLDRRLPDVREGRGDRQDRLLAQPVLHAAGRSGGPGDAGPAGHSGLAVRHRLQRRRAVVRRDPEPRAGDHAQGVRDRGLRPGDGRGEVQPACCARSASALRRTVASRRASTASSCCWPTSRTSERPSPSRSTATPRT